MDKDELLDDMVKMGLIDDSDSNNIYSRLLNVYTLFFHPFAYYLIRALKGCNSAIDLGCGKNSPIRYVKDLKYKVGVDIHEAYLIESKVKNIHDEYILCDLRNIHIKEKFDASVCLNVIEHLRKDDAIALIDKMEKMAQKKCILYTCNGEWPQEPFDDNPHQLHVSGWNAEELRDLGYEVYGMGGIKRIAEILNRNNGKLYKDLYKYKFSTAIFKILLVDLPQKFAYRNPNVATDLFAIKDVSR